MEPKVHSTMPFAVGARGGAGWTLMPRLSQAAVKARETKTLPRSTTIVSGSTTGRAVPPDLLTAQHRSKGDRTTAAPGARQAGLGELGAVEFACSRRR